VPRALTVLLVVALLASGVSAATPRQCEQRDATVTQLAIRGHALKRVETSRRDVRRAAIDVVHAALPPRRFVLIAPDRGAIALAIVAPPASRTAPIVARPRARAPPAARVTR
jgi:hypothetical protein